MAGNGIVMFLLLFPGSHIQKKHERGRAASLVIVYLVSLEFGGSILVLLFLIVAKR